MKRNIASYLLLSIFLICGILVQTTDATDGYFRHGYGIKYSAMGGAGVALSLSSIGAATNPASIVFLDGTRFDINVALFSPSRSFNVTGNPSGYPGTFPLAPGEVESESNYFPMPTMGASFKVADNMALGLMFYGNGGMNTNYPTVIFNNPMAPEVSPGTGVNLEQMFLGTTYAIEISKNHSLGLTGLFGFQRFSAKGLTAFGAFSSSPQNLTGNHVSTSTGFGARIGYLGKLSETISVGLSYQTKMNMSEFEEYSGLFAEAGDFDIPSNWTAGIALNANKDWTFALDVQQILYTDVASVSNPINPMALPPAFLNQGGDPMNPMDYTPNPNHVPLGADEGSGFGWEDVMAFKLGGMYKGVEGWTFMAGYSYANNPVPESEVMFNILAPGIMQHHITFGATKHLCNGQEITASFMIAPTSEVTGANPFEAPGAQTIGISMSQWQFELGYAF